MFLWKFLKFDYSKYKGCYIPLEPDLYVDFDFRETTDLVAFTEEIVNRKINFLYSEICLSYTQILYRLQIENGIRQCVNSS